MEESTSIQWVKVLKMKIVKFSNSVDLDDPEIGGFPFQVFEFAVLYSLDQTVFLFFSFLLWLLLSLCRRKFCRLLFGATSNQHRNLT